MRNWLLGFLFGFVLRQSFTLPQTILEFTTYRLALKWPRSSCLSPLSAKIMAVCHQDLLWQLISLRMALTRVYSLAAFKNIIVSKLRCVWGDTQLIEYLSSMYRSLGLIHSTTETRHGCLYVYSSAWEVEEYGSEFPGHLWLHSEFEEDRLVYIGPCLKTYVQINENWKHVCFLLKVLL